MASTLPQKPDQFLSGRLILPRLERSGAGWRVVHALQIMGVVIQPQFSKLRIVLNIS